MDKSGYFNKLNIESEIINLIKDFCYIEEFALGDEIANSENLDLKMYYKNQAESNLFENIKFIDDAENILSSIVK